MENMRMKTNGADANGSRFVGKVKDQAVNEIQLGCRKLSLGKVTRSPKNPNPIKPRKDVQFRFGDKRPLAQATKRTAPVVNITWDDVEKYLGGNMEARVVVGSVDKRDLDEAIERNEEPDEIYFRASEKMRRKAHEYATAAISFMRKKGHNLELVKPCLYGSGETATGVRIHFNFKAKRADDRSAPVETYFGQLRLCTYSGLVVECCVSLGASDTLPYERDNRGCKYCVKFVHHPEGGCKGIIWGRVTWSQQKNRLVVT